jgi:WD40 repeat protein
LWIATAQSKSISIWDLESGRQVRSFDTAAEVNAITWTPGGERIVTGDANRNVVVWQPDTGTQQAVLRGHEGNVTAVAVSPDGRRVLSGTGSIWARPGELRLWNLESLELERVLEGHADSVFSIAWSGDSRYAITGSADRTAVLWDCSSGKRIYRLDAHGDSVFATCISPDGRFALTGGKDGALRIWTLDWELDEGRLMDWDENAARHIEYFASLKRAYASQPRTAKRIAPKDELPLLLYQLGCAGFGSLDPNAVVSKLHQIEAKGSSPIQKRLKRGIRPRFWRR